MRCDNKIQGKKIAYFLRRWYLENQAPPSHALEGHRMTDEPNIKGYAVDLLKLPKDYPTQRLPGEFWEELGRTVATFGFLEETLGRAIFAITGTRQIAEEDVEAELAKWLLTLQKALSDPLGN